MFEGKFLGYIAIGHNIYFRPSSGPDAFVCATPEDVDPHMLAAALNDAANCVFRVAKEMSQFKF